VLPIGDRFTMGPDDALAAVKLIKPCRVVPSHYNTWPPSIKTPPPGPPREERDPTEPIVIEPGGRLSFNEAAPALQW